ncbi:MAG: division/cell wall cluster transcriptional repressor MraZ [Lachnospiraceae bacterium]|nr:division/cell wall cluster transcriptional repressor MraZ [Lachnospiraceae bacterium]MBQ1171748.1 division/cell wall cluster transcriptional repressor MraZ [Lachnospiraceae bacterium]
MFMGEYNHSIDAKGRLIIPSKFRDMLGDEFVVTKGLEGCLFVFEKYEFESFMDKLNEKSDLEAKVRKIKRFFISGAQEMEPDKQGRMLVPPTLREYAGLEKEVVFAGVGGHIEIWDKSKWDDVTSFDDINDIAEELSSIGISF